MTFERKLDPALLSTSDLVHGPREAANERAALQAHVEFAKEPRAPERALAPPPVTAVLVVHGMGQQLPFETLDALANGLYQEDVRSYGQVGAQPARVAHVQLGDQSLERVEMQLRDPQGRLRDVHVYEAYWAPLTEGAVNLRDVIGFLIDAGLNGLKNSMGRFLRWSFNDLRKYYIPLHTLLYLLIALLVVIALVVLNAAISAIGGTKALFTSEPAWLTQKLFDDYSTVLSLVVGTLELFTIATLIGMLLSGARKWLILRLSAPVSRGLMLIVSMLSVVLFAASIIAIVDAASAVPTLYRLKSALPRWMNCTATIVQAWQLWFVLAAGVLLAGYFVLTVIRSYISQLSSRAAVHWPAHVALLFFVLLLLSVWLLAKSLSPGATRFADMHQWRILLMWGVLVILSLIVRTFLIDYLGDVVAYVEPHKLDRLAELRTKIKDRVLKIAQAIYAERGAGGHFEYRQVVLVGHSLGSVIVYDTLNRLLLDDQAAVGAGRPWNVSGRSPYLLTFGSPLNKIAFVFATQSKKGSMTLARERLASLVQPLIDSEVVRAGIRWVNIYSPWDIISGRLDFYDPPPGGPAFPVLDERDPDATTFLAAHTEYWRNTLLFAWLHAMV
jgi:hypothetical protein